MSEQKQRKLPVTKVQADECNRLNQLVAQAMADVSLYTTAILHGHGITTPHALVRIIKKDDGYSLVVTEHKQSPGPGD